jgi:tellurite resistance protein
MISESANRLKEMINKAIEDHKISPAEYDQIINLASEDGNIDNQEKALLRELQKMIENKMIKWSPK